MTTDNLTIEDYKQALLHCKVAEKYPFMVNADGSLKKPIAQFERKELIGVTANEVSSLRFTIGNKIFLVESEPSVKRYEYLERYILECKIYDIDILQFVEKTLAEFLRKPFTYHSPQFLGDLARQRKDVETKIKHNNQALTDGKFLNNPYMKIAAIFINEAHEARSEFSDDLCQRKIAIFNQGIDYDEKLTYGFFFTIALTLCKNFIKTYNLSHLSFSTETAKPQIMI